MWVEESFAEFVNINVLSGDFGLSYRSSAGKVSDSSLSVNCNGVDINGMISVGTKEYPTNVSNNVITTAQGTPITAYAGSLAEIHNNDLSGASGDQELPSNQAARQFTATTSAP